MAYEYYRKKVKEYKKRIKNTQILMFVNFLEILLDWLDNLYKYKRVRREQENEISQYFPEEVFNELDKISTTEISKEEYDNLKRILLKESSELINFIINIGKLRMTDFDLLQFNLSGIFKKEEITTMIEWARQHLSTLVLEGRDEELKEQEEKRKAEEEWLRKIKIMPQKEINKLILQDMFDFSPKARTNEERIEAIKNNQKKVIAQRKKFENFERKLIDASQEAAGQSQTNVFRKIGEVKREMEIVRNKFRKKAEKIVSPEGPRKELRKARIRILKSKEQTSQQISDAEKMFDKARKDIAEKKQKLGQEEKIKGEVIKKQGLAQIELGKHTVEQSKKHMEDEKAGAEELFEAGRTHLARAKKHMEDEKRGTEKMFSKGRQNLAYAKKHLEEEQQNFEKRKTKAGNIFELVEARLKKEKVRGKKWVEKEKKRIALLEAGLKQRRKTAEKLKEKMISARAGVSKVGVLVPGKPQLPGLGIDKKDIQEKYELKKDTLKKQLQKKKQLFEYDLRFKRDELQQRALKQKEDMINKFEEFEERQRALMARYRASRKAYMIRTLLKAIRTIH